MFCSPYIENVLRISGRGLYTSVSWGNSPWIFLRDIERHKNKWQEQGYYVIKAFSCVYVCARACMLLKQEVVMYDEGKYKSYYNKIKCSYGQIH